MTISFNFYRRVPLRGFALRERARIPTPRGEEGGAEARRLLNLLTNRSGIRGDRAGACAGDRAGAREANLIP